MLVVGADVWRGQWVAVVLRDGSFEQAKIFKSIADVAAVYKSADVIGVDMPIGLVESGHRPADDCARRVVGAKLRSSVFPAPTTTMLSHETAEAANRSAAATGEVGISRQAFALKSKILEVAEVQERDRRLTEVHPEVSFAIALGEPLSWSKRSWNGRAQRLAILRKEGIALPNYLDLEAGNASVDDVMDAAIGAWSALRVAHKQAMPFPEPGHPTCTIWA